jgi:tetratricopeptide (TPR) repeat protein
MHKSPATFRSTLLLPFLAMALGSLALAQQPAERNYQFEDDTIEMLDLYRKEGDAPVKDYAKMLALLDDRLAKLKNKSGYDYAMLLEFKAKIFIEKGDYSKAIAPMEQGLALSDAATPTYLEERSTTDVSFFLAQLFFQESTTLKNTDAILALYNKSELYLTRWLKSTSKVNEEGLSFYASVLYAHATLDDKHIDKERITHALDLINQCMHLSAHPKDGLYLYKMACLQQLDRVAESAEVFELILKRKPENKEYWKQLASTYLQLEQPVRAIATLERAQALGLLNTPADNYSLFGIYFNEGQFEQAAELLEKGFRENSIENTEQTWELLASCYLQLNRDLKAIDALKRATKFYPKSGQLDFLIGQNYYSIKKLDEALPYLQRSVSKGGGNKPAQTYILMAYIAYELKKLDIALEAANKVITFPDGVKEGTRFKKAVLDAIEEREAKKNKM